MIHRVCVSRSDLLLLIDKFEGGNEDEHGF